MRTVPRQKRKVNRSKADTGDVTRSTNFKVRRIGDLLRKIREELHLNLEQMAALIEWDEPRLSKAENNHEGVWVPLEVLQKMADALGDPERVWKCVEEAFRNPSE
ncbi:MAG TPA: helix-turn-helix transcriptional regulator [Pirellulales bacterium]|nr:helix-turn-helix transcriptional regulator [Pirellulales bacterium]